MYQLNRKSGVLLHISSLNGNESVGTLGKEAYNFIDFMNSAGLSYWQVLPIGPTGYANCPYQALSSFAGNFMFINIETLCKKYQLDFSTLEHDLSIENFETASSSKWKLLKSIFNLVKPRICSESLLQFKLDNNYWLSNYCLFMAIKEKQNYTSIYEWPLAFRLKDERTLAKFSQKESELIDFNLFVQFEF